MIIREAMGVSFEGRHARFPDRECPGTTTSPDRATACGHSTEPYGLKARVFPLLYRHCGQMSVLKGSVVVVSRVVELSLK